LIKITPQTEAKFTPEEFELFLQTCPEKDQQLLHQVKQSIDGKIVIDIEKLDKNQFSSLTWEGLNRMTHNTPYKFKVARVGMNAQSVAHIMIIVFIILGNIGYFLQKAQTGKK